MEPCPLVGVGLKPAPRKALVQGAWRGLAILLALSAALPAWGAPDRASEDEMFGGGAATPAPTQAKPSKPMPAGDDARGMEEGPGAKGMAADPDLLQIGGSFYQRAQASLVEGQLAGDMPFNLPLQVDTYLDARPNDRLRGYLGARMLYDSTLDSSGNTTRGGINLPSNSPATFTGPGRTNPRVALDQAWLKFDLNRKIFVTLGKQHVKWGAARIWNPTDALSPERRDPLQPYDLRLGAGMAKFQVPLGGDQSSLYAIALLDNPQAASTLGQAGGAFRLESVALGAEWGLDAVLRRGEFPLFGMDLSTPLGPFDAYAEAAVMSGKGRNLYEFLGKPAAGADLSTAYRVSRADRPLYQVSAGLNHTFAWRTNRMATLGAEYFYNEAGVTHGGLYPVLIYFGDFQPFYAGRHYAALYLNAQGPDSGNKTAYTLSTIANASDASYVSRLDFSWQAFDQFTFGAWASARYGTEGGEFNFSLHTPALTYQGSAIPQVDLPAVPLELGTSLRLRF